MKRAGLTYTGWEKDVRWAEGYHVKYPILFDDHVLAMRKKQKIHLGDRSHPQLQTIDRMKREGLTYTGWRADISKLEDYHVNYPFLFDDHVLVMRKKQKIHLGDRSHPQLQTIDRLKRAGLTYNGWEKDVRRAEGYHVNDPILFDDHVLVMRKKQTTYAAQQNARRLVAQVSHCPQQPRESDCNRKEPVSKKARRSDDKQNQANCNEEECVVCLSSKRTHAFVPCGHMCVCDGCAVLIKNRSCPICRMVSQQIIKIYQ